jgi:hydrogenase large subunit
MFRGTELILRGRDPREAWISAQRICGVRTTVHALASVRAVEDALGIEVPDNARLARSFICRLAECSGWSAGESSFLPDYRLA